MKTKIAILVGTLANGFHIDQILEDVSKAEDAVIGHLANGKLGGASENGKNRTLRPGERA